MYYIYIHIILYMLPTDNNVTYKNNHNDINDMLICIYVYIYIYHR